MTTLFHHPLPDKCLRGKTIMITGSTSGIGRAVAKAFAELGAQLILHGKDDEKLNALHDEIQLEGYISPILVNFNLETITEEQVAELNHLIVNEIGQLDGLLHNAGIITNLTSIKNTSLVDFQQCLQVNLTASFILAKGLLPALQAAPHASLVFTSSSVGRKGRAFWGPYGISKAGCENLMELMHDELSNTSNIRVNSLNPGGARTQMRAKAYPHENPNTLPQPEDITNLYCYLMSDESRHIKGEKLNIRLPSS